MKYLKIDNHGSALVFMQDLRNRAGVAPHETIPGITAYYTKDHSYIIIMVANNKLSLLRDNERTVLHDDRLETLPLTLALI